VIRIYNFAGRDIPFPAPPHKCVYTIPAAFVLLLASLSLSAPGAPRLGYLKIVPSTLLPCLGSALTVTLASGRAGDYPSQRGCVLCFQSLLEYTDGAITKPDSKKA